MAVARDLAGGTENIVAVAGDAAFTNGISFEALNNIGDQTKRLIVVLNDNEWSIDRNVGAIAELFPQDGDQRALQAPACARGPSDRKIRRQDCRESRAQGRGSCEGPAWPSMLFEEFGLNYYGPLDGHNIDAADRTFKFLKTQDKPVLLHVMTQKGRGFQPAMEKQKKFHGLGPYDPKTGETKPAGQRTYSEVFAETLVKLANKDEKVVAITAAMPNGTGARPLPAAPSQALLRRRDCRGTRGHLRGGNGDEGIRPFCAIYSTFLQRAFDPIVHDVCLQNLPVVFCMDRGGLSRR